MLLPSLVLVSIGAVAALDVGDDIKFQLDLVKHSPCAFKEGKSHWTRKLEFEGGTGISGPRLEPVEGKMGCYTVGGKVNVHEDFYGNFSIYVEIRNTAKKNSLPESCVMQGENGCGGIGSCLYCDACSTFENHGDVQATLLVDGKKVRCNDGLKKGMYDDLKLQFCLPRLDAILESQGLTKETFLSLIMSDDGRSLRSFGVFATVYVFDTDVARQMVAQTKVSNIYRKSKNSFFVAESLPPDVYWSLPFNSLIKKQESFVACHKIYGNIKIQTP